MDRSLIQLDADPLDPEAAALADARVCRTCSVLKPNDEYGRYDRAPDGIMTQCRACHNAARVLRYNQVEQDPRNPRPDASWMIHAACRNMPADLFFPGRGESTAEALQACSTCPVIDQCRDYSLASHEKSGVWGGLSEAGRRRLRKRAS